MQISAVVTTSRKPSAGAVALAEETAARLSLLYVPRGTQSLAEIAAAHGAEALLVAKKSGLVLMEATGELFFHPNMAHLRIKNLRAGQRDNLCEAMGLTAGMRVLDCTLGLGADAIVESFVTGEAGRVVALESSPLVHAVVAYGLAHYEGESPWTTAAMRRIEPVCAEALDFLRAQEADAFDVVYFDPMFRHPLTRSEALAPLRAVANPAPVSAALLSEARRVARCRVVLKETARSTEFSRLGCSRVTGGRYSPVHYGVWDV